jgi:hypothetical protein
VLDALIQLRDKKGNKQSVMAGQTLIFKSYTLDNYLTFREQNVIDNAVLVLNIKS